MCVDTHAYGHMHIYTYTDSNRIWKEFLLVFMGTEKHFLSFAPGLSYLITRRPISWIVFTSHFQTLRRKYKY